MKPRTKGYTPKARRIPSDFVTPVIPFSRSELILRYGAGAPNASSHPSSDDALAKELRDAGNKLIAAALAYEANAAQKRALLRFGYGSPEWLRPLDEHRTTSARK